MLKWLGSRPVGSRGLELEETRSVRRARHKLGRCWTEGQQRIARVGKGSGCVFVDRSDVGRLETEVRRRGRDVDAEVARRSQGRNHVRVVGRMICVHGLAGTCGRVDDGVAESHLRRRDRRIYIC